MPIEIEIRRHSIKDGPTSQMIGPNGYRLARAVGEQQLRGRGFTHFFASTYWRTHQTLAAFAEGAGDFKLKMVPGFAPVYVMGQDVQTMWRACRKAELEGEDMVEAAFAFDAVLAAKVAGDTAGLCRDWMRTMTDGTRALVVGHSPSLELMLFGLLGEKIPGLAECAGYRLSEQNGCEAYFTDEPRLDPSTIRRSLGI